MSSLKYKNPESGKWEKLRGGGAGMPPSIYDPQGRKTDVFEYIDNKAITGGSGISVGSDEPVDAKLWVDTDDGPTGEYSVTTSFKGRTGDVMPQDGDYTAEMVGAASKSHASQHAAGGSDPITPKAIGAAPAGYGLGADGETSETAYTTLNRADIDMGRATGIYWFSDAENPIYPDAHNSGKSGLLIHLRHNAANTMAIKQIFVSPNKHGNTDTYAVLERTRRGANDWTPWEWRNPPMRLGVEYRTTERYNGQPVYKKCIYNKLPTDGTVVEIPVADGTAITFAWLENVIAASSDGMNTFPSSPKVPTVEITCDNYDNTSTYIKIINNNGGSGSFFAVVNYVKA